MQDVLARPQKHFLVGILAGLTAIVAGCGNLEANQTSAVVSSQALSTQRYNIPEAAGSLKAWSGGSLKAWSGGSYKAWSGGSASSYIIPDNAAVWDQVHLRQAQAIAPNLGKGVIVAMIDTGIDLKHPAFSDSLTDSSTWKDYVDGDTTPQEVGQPSDAGYGHGTLIAGIVLQAAPKALILPLRVLGKDGSGDPVAIAAAIKYAASKGAKVINLSLGTAGLDCNILNAVASLPAGVSAVISAGNQGQSTLTYPAAVSWQPLSALGCIFTSSNTNLLFAMRTIGVGSVSSKDKLSSFSNYGFNLELLAPGENIYGPIPGGNVGAWSGTSMAAGFVSGALALANGQKISSQVDASNIATYVSDTADSVESVNASGLKGQLGWGRLNIERFLKRVVLGQ